MTDNHLSHTKTLQDQIAAALERAAAELHNWETETGRPLPRPAEQIAALEAHGYIVDLETGQVHADPDAVPPPSYTQLILLAEPLDLE